MAPVRMFDTPAVERAFEQQPKETNSTALCGSATTETSPQVIGSSLLAGDVLIRPEPSCCLRTRSLLKLQAVI